jgi:hypothetical protein
MMDALDPADIDQAAGPRLRGAGRPSCTGSHLCGRTPKATSQRKTIWKINDEFKSGQARAASIIVKPRRTRTRDSEHDHY